MIVRSYLSVLLAGLLGLVSACSSNEAAQEKEVAKVPKLDFGDHKAVVKAVDKYISRNTLEKGLVFLSMRDELEKKDLYLSPPVGYDSVTYRLSENTISLGVAMNPNDAKDVRYVLDFKCEWDDKLMVNDSLQGGIKVTQIDIRSVGDKPRYKWQKQGQYWEKTPVVVQ
jgi:sorbitol-specific phosphotransferase system component IIA